MNLESVVAPYLVARGARRRGGDFGHEDGALGVHLRVRR